MNAKRIIASLSAFVSLGLGISAHATQLISNGSFTSYTATGSQNEVNDTGGHDTGGVNLTGWTTSSYYTFLVTPALATASAGNSAVSQTLTGIDGNISFWMGSSPQFSTSPDGGDFIAADGAYQTGTLQQTVSGLAAGDRYQLSFYQAGAQQSGFTGATTDQWEVSLGSQTQYSSLITDASQSFSGWQYVTMSFVATGNTETLSFFAIGTPNGVPPFTLLDGVSLTDVPEPASWGLMMVGLIGVAGARRWIQSRR